MQVLKCWFDRRGKGIRLLHVNALGSGCGYAPGSSPSAQELLKQKKNSVDLVRKRTILTERPPLVDEVNANFSG
jgi:hypothetical protein